MRICILILIVLSVTACGHSYPPASPTLSDTQINHRFQPGDQVKVIVFEEDDLSGVFPVNAKGEISLPLLKPLNIKGQTEIGAASIIAAALKKDYVRDPKVSVSLDRPSFIFVLGEVHKPGNYPYIPGMTVLQAVAQSGGYTYRADMDDIILTRKQTKKYSAQEDTPLLPGDTIKIEERYF